MNISIQKATPEDMPAVLGLINELAVYEKEPEAVKITEKTLLENGFGEHPLFTCFVAKTAPLWKPNEEGKQCQEVKHEDYRACVEHRLDIEHYSEAAQHQGALYGKTRKLKSSWLSFFIVQLIQAVSCTVSLSKSEDCKTT